MLGNVAQQMGLYKQCRYGLCILRRGIAKIVAVDPAPPALLGRKHGGILNMGNAGFLNHDRSFLVTSWVDLSVGA
jgi:hypothetical protein